MSTPSDAYQLARFCELAQTGRSLAASSGERVANKLARALKEIGDDMALLDEDAIEGFYQLCKRAHGPWRTDAEKDRAFQIIDRAAG